MPIPDIQQTEYLKKIWADAYNGIPLIVDYTGEDEAEGRLQRFRYALYNYRRRIRRNKLKPTLAEEWSRILECQVNLISSTRFEVTRPVKLLHKRVSSKLSGTSLPLPILLKF